MRAQNDKVMQLQNNVMQLQNNVMQPQSKEKLLKRARVKYLTRKLVLALIESNPKSPLLPSYRNTYYCNQVLTKDEGTIKGTYCKNRWCMLCGRIRTGHLINGYGVQLKQLNDLYFVTLTLKTVNAKGLSERIVAMEKEWRKIMNLVAKKKINNFIGLRKAECTIRPDDKYHYHFHVLVNIKENADFLLAEWIKRFGKLANTGVHTKGQDIRKADEGSLKEMFKYFTKLTVKPEDIGEVKAQGKERMLIPFKRMDFIFRTLKGKRTFQPFGGLRLVSEEIDATLYATTIPDSYQGDVWQWIENDWISEYGECLTEYKPSGVIRTLVRNCPEKITKKIINLMDGTKAYSKKKLE